MSDDHGYNVMSESERQRKRLTLDEIAELQRIAIERSAGSVTSSRWQLICRRENELLTKQRNEHVIGPVT